MELIKNFIMKKNFKDLPTMFIEGYFSDQIKRGIYPDYGPEPGTISGLPKADNKKMEVKTSYKAYKESLYKYAKRNNILEEYD